MPARRPSARTSARRSEPRGPPPFLLLDTNALLSPFREGFPLERELERFAPRNRWRVPSSVARELARLSRDGMAAAEAARGWAKRFDQLAAPGSGDTAIVVLARRTGSWVVTADRRLLAELRASGVTTLRPRGRSSLALVEPVRPERPARASSRPRPVTVKSRPPLRTRSRGR